MPDLRPGAARIADLFGSIQSAVSEHMTTSELWSHLREAAESQGRSLQGVNAIDVGQLRHLAAGLRNAVSAFDRASPDAPIAADAIAENIYSRSLGAHQLAQAYHVRFSLQIAAAGEARTLTRTYVIPGMLPGTKRELMDTLNAYGQALAEQGDSDIEIGSELLGVSGIQISWV